MNKKDLTERDICTYSLRQGIDDGFLAPYKVVRIDFDKDLMGWRPDKGMVDKYGNEIEDRILIKKIWTKLWCSKNKFTQHK
jgi:type I restriction enzyme R subunit